MIQYTLKCEHGHSFDSWFKSSAAFDALKAQGLVECGQCGATSVDKAIMAPSVAGTRKRDDEGATQPMVATPDAEMQHKLAEMKRHVEANSDYVGTGFAKEARAMHLGDAPERAIYGEANAKEAKSLIEDGVPVLPLPFKPTKDTN